jgi:hypothetical protein
MHAESLKDIQDRLELVFGIPASSMLATERYTFLHKFRFGRKERLYRIVNKAYESDPAERKFVETFEFARGTNIKESHLDCKFVKNPEASNWMLNDLDMGKMEKDLNIEFIPPVLQRRSGDSGIEPKQYILEAFMKGKVYSQIYKSSMDLNNKELTEMGFVLKCNSALRKLMIAKEKENGSIDYGDLQKEWDITYPALVKEEMRAVEITRAEEQAAKQAAQAGGLGTLDSGARPPPTVQ